MSPHESDRRHFERQLVYARPIIVLLALLALFEQPHSNGRQRSIYFLVAFFLVSLVLIQIERLIRKGSWHLPLVWDLLARGAFMYLSPSSVPVWFPYLFLCYAAGIFWGLDAALPLAGALSLLLVLLTAHRGEIQWMRVVAWLGLTGGTFAGGAGLAFLGDRSRRFASESEFFSRIVGTLQVDQGLAESLRLLLDELATAFLVEEALLAYRDLDLERIFLVNSRKPFERADLYWLERIARHVGPSLENVFLLRHLRARAIEGERSRISRDLHDGILQTLLSIEIQLDVLRRRAAAAPEQAVSNLANLQQTVRNESAELRHMVTDLRPLRVQSADLVDLMRGFAERYRNE